MTNTTVIYRYTITVAMFQVRKKEAETGEH